MGDMPSASEFATCVPQLLGNAAINPVSSGRPQDGHTVTCVPNSEAICA